MIATPGPLLSPATAARAAGGAGRASFWISAPDRSGRAREFVGGGSGLVLIGESPDDLAPLERVWRERRALWSADGVAPSGVPVGVGWFSYELGRRLVGLPPDPRAAGEPLFHFYFPDLVWAWSGPEAMCLAPPGTKTRPFADWLRRPLAGAVEPTFAPLRPLDPPAGFLEGVRRVRAYEEAGDAYQVNLSRRLRGAWTGEPAGIAAALRAAAPAPHAVLLETASGQAVLGNSPERFLSVSRDGLVETRPIKGTRPRGASSEEDRAAVADLRASLKDRAEHVMIVDLERNDLGRVCRTGTVEIAELARVVSLSTVHHLESTVRGLLRPHVGLAELLAATFPGGSITGAPKRRAMQIIDELEAAPRGVYTGATGWLGAAGDLDLAVAIRTATLHRGELDLSVGGGIVIDSSPEDELAETEVKARAFASLAGGAPPG